MTYLGMKVYVSSSFQQCFFHGMEKQLQTRHAAKIDEMNLHLQVLLSAIRQLKILQNVVGLLTWSQKKKPQTSIGQIG